MRIHFFGIAPFNSVKRSIRAVAFAAIPFTLITSADAAATDYYWTGATDATWTGSNWSLDPSGAPPAMTIPGTSSDVIFSAATSGNLSTTLGANFEINSLTVQDANPITIGGANTLTVSGTEGGGGVFVESGSGGLTINSNLSLSTGAGTFSVAASTSASVAGIISGVDLTKTGDGTLTVSATNTYQGRTTVKDGTLVVDTGSVGRIEKDVAVGDESGDIGTLQIVNGGTVSADFAFIGNQSGSQGTVSIDNGTWTTRTSLFVGNSGDGSLNINSGSASADFVYIGSQLGSTGSISIASGTFTIGSEIYVGGDDFDGSGTGSLNVNGGTVTVDSGTGTIYVGYVFGSTGTLNVGSGASAGGLNAFEVNGGAGTAAANFNHTNDITVTSKLTGSLSVTKSGSGKTTLTAANTYSGSTTINGGSLIINGSLASPTVMVASGGTLGGTGSLAGAVTVNGSISPGSNAGPATLTTGNQTWNGGGNFVWEINNSTGAAGTGWDLLSINGTLTIASSMGTPFVININTLTLGNLPGDMANFMASQDAQWTIASATVAIAGFDPAKFSVSTAGFENAFDGDFSVALSPDTKSLYLVYTAVPEPSAYGLAIIGAILLIACSRRKRNS